MSELNPIDEHIVDAFGRARQARSILETFLALVLNEPSIKPSERTARIQRKVACSGS